MSRARWHTTPDEFGDCQDCDREFSGKGAMGRAAQHHDATGHVIRMEQTFVHYYGEDQPGQRRWWKGPT